MRTRKRLFAITLPLLAALPAAAQAPSGFPPGAIAGSAGAIATPRPAPPPQGSTLSRPPSPFRGSAPQGTATADEIPLSLGDVIERALQANLGAIGADLDARVAEAQRERALSALLP